MRGQHKGMRQCLVPVQYLQLVKNKYQTKSFSAWSHCHKQILENYSNAMLE